MISEQGLGDDAAIPLREIVDDDPSQVEAAILLAGILERSGREDDLSELLAKQIDSAKDRSDATSVGSLSLRLAALQEKKSPVEAKATLYAALEWEPKNLELLTSLARLHADPGEAADRADVLERILPLQSGDLAEKIATDLHALRTELADVEGAERALDLGYRANPQGAIGTRLEKLYKERGAWAKLAELYAVDASTQVDAARRIARLREAATLYAKQVLDPAKGAALLREARTVAPDDTVLLEELVEMLADASDFGAAVTELSAAIDRPVSTRRESDASGAAADATQAPLYAGRSTLRVRLGEMEAAAADQEHAFKLGGEPFAAALVSQLASLKADAAGRGDAAAERSFAMRLAEVLPATGDADQARSLLSDLLKQNPKDRDALRLLGRIDEDAQHWDAVTATYRRLVALEEGDAVVGTALRLADACERAGRFSDARGALERARLAAPLDEALRARLADLYERSGDYKELAEMSLADAKSSKDVAGRFVHLLRAGALLVQHGADTEIAVTALAEAHALRPSDAECTVLLADAYTVAGRSAEAVELINQAIASHKGKRSRELGALYHRLARVAHHAEDQASELAWLASALDMDGQSGFVASELATVAMGLGQMEVATRALRTITMLKPPVASPISKAMAYQYLAEIARQQGDVKRAVMLLKRAVDEDPALDSARALLESLQE
jgi:tetratricopeptide (TPR) repeat protein